MTIQRLKLELHQVPDWTAPRLSGIIGGFLISNSICPCNTWYVMCRSWEAPGLLRTTEMRETGTSDRGGKINRVIYHSCTKHPIMKDFRIGHGCWWKSVVQPTAAACCTVCLQLYLFYRATAKDEWSLKGVSFQSPWGLFRFSVLPLTMRPTRTSFHHPFFLDSTKEKEGWWPQP